MADECGVTVCVRVRPLIRRENANLDEETIYWKSEKCTISQVDGTKSFTFDRVFHSEENTAEVYEGVAVPIIKSAVQGYNGTIFAYGQTASGKTYTMLGTKESPGILLMAIQDVFKTICGIPDREFLLRISYMEIHNETIKDLLCTNIRKNKPLVLREDINRNIYVEDLNEEVVVSPEQVMSWLQKGEKSRHYGETKMNERSSRSHTIFRMIIESKEKTDTSDSNSDGAVMVSHLNLVDLAGSERASQTGTEGIRLKEGCNINRSLFILGQVIKKLCDEPTGSFINYRDSKLTRILQNSLGGNAKTVIICTVTPISLEETLSTLQFASTAKKMKNSPIVNEVLDDNALLKRYRTEIEDLKRRLEEVSSDSHIREIEKDQLAQLLEEKNSLQKQQQDRIRALTEMLVTASSFSQERELKAKRKRRVTWAPGKIRADGNEHFLDNLPEKAKKVKHSLPALSEMEELFFENLPTFSECDDRTKMSEEEFIPGPEVSFSHRDLADSVQLYESLVLERDNAVSDHQAIQTKLDHLQLEKEQLECELRELKEKMETNEFVVLEKETAKEQEMQLMHDIAKLKTVIANAEVYNQDLQDVIKSKELQVTEKENKIKALEKNAEELKHLVEELQRSDCGEKDVSLGEVSSKMVDEMKQSLCDAETVAMDAKRESSFLRSENQALKEEMRQLLDTSKKMEGDAERYRRQLEAGKATYKAMQADLQKELQYFCQENAKLTSLLEGKVPKDLLSFVELERKIVDLKKELNEVLEDNATLRKEVATLSEAGLRPDPEVLQKELHSKIQEKELEQETFLSMKQKLDQAHEKLREMEQLQDHLKACEFKIEVEEKEKFALARRLQEGEEEMRTLVQEMAELKQKQDALQLERDQLKDDIQDTVSMNIEAQEELRNSQNSLKQYQKRMEELEETILANESQISCLKDTLEKTTKEHNLQIYEFQDDVEQVNLGNSQSLKGEAKELGENNEVQLIQGEANEFLLMKEQLLCLNEERNVLHQQLETLQEEKLQCQEDNQKLTSKIQELQAKCPEEDGLVGMTEELCQARQKLSEMESLRDLLKASESRLEEERIGKTTAIQQLQDYEEAMRALTQERDDLRHSRDALQMERDEITNNMQEAQSKNTEAQEELRNSLKQYQKHIEELEETILDKESQISHVKETLEKASNEHNLQILKFTEELEQVNLVKHQLIQGEANEFLLMKEQLLSLKEERNVLQQELETLQEEKHQCQVHNQKLTSKIQERQAKSTEEDGLVGMTEELCQARQKLSEMESLRDRLKASESRLEEERIGKTTAIQQLQDYEEAMRALTQERDDLRHSRDALQMERDEICHNMQDIQSKVKAENIEAQEELRNSQSSLKQYQKRMEELEETILANESQILCLKDTLEKTTKEHSLQIAKFTEELERVNLEKHQLIEGKANELGENNELLLMKEQLLSLKEERNVLQQQLETLQEEKRQCQEDNQMLTSKIQELQAKNLGDDALVDMKQELCQAQQKLSEMESLREQLKASNSRIEAAAMGKMTTAQKLQDYEEAMRALTQERDDLKHSRDTLQMERDAIANNMQEMQSKMEQLEEEFLCQKQMVEFSDRRQQNTIDEIEQLKANVSTVKNEKVELLQRLCDTEGELKSITEQKETLKTMVSSLHAERDTMTQTVHRLGEAIENITAVNLELQEQLRNTNGSLKEHHNMVEQLKRNILDKNDQVSEAQEALGQTVDQLKQKAVETQAEKEKLLLEVKYQAEEANRQKNLVDERQEQLRKLEVQFADETAQLREKLQQLTEDLRAKAEEKHLLLVQQQAKTDSMQQLMMERESMQQTVKSIEAENDQLRGNLLQMEEKLSEAKAKLEHALSEQRLQPNNVIQEKSPEKKEQNHLEILQAKVLKITELVKNFPNMEKRYECLEEVSSHLKRELSCQKALIAKGLSDLSSDQTRKIKGLQMEHEQIRNSLNSLLNKHRFFFIRLCKKEEEYCNNVSKYTVELLNERRKQDLLNQILNLKELHLEQQDTVAKDFALPELEQNLDLHIEQILKDLSSIEELLLDTEAKLQQLAGNSQEGKLRLEQCLVHFDVQNFEGVIKQAYESLLPVGRLLKPKTQVFIEAKSELETRNTDYCMATKAVLKTCQEETKELLQKLSVLSERQTSCGIANLVLEEENHKLVEKLKATNQDIKALKLNIQELEASANEAEGQILEKEKKLAGLEVELKARASRSEVVRLRAVLEERESCLKSASAERDTLKTQLDKGSELYKEEIENLKTQVAKAEMARMKQSKYFDQEMANARALVEHRDEQVRKLKEEIRRNQEEQDVTIMSSSEHISQRSLPITCGGGSGIVQSTQMLVLKAEHAKLEKEHGQLKKQHELMQNNELFLKEEVKKWKARALKVKEQLSSDVGEEQTLKTPRKMVPPLFAQLQRSPSKECSRQSVLPLDTPPSLQPAYPTSFFDNSCLGTLTDGKHAGVEAAEHKHWAATENKDNCKTQ